jgi:hypothetical protein
MNEVHTHLLKNVTLNQITKGHDEVWLIPITDFTKSVKNR